VNANIIVCVKYDPGTDERTEFFEWQGSEDGGVIVSGELMRDTPDLLGRLPWAMEITEYNEARDLYVIRRKVTP
jgi:hypothetical protein